MHKQTNCNIHIYVVTHKKLVNQICEQKNFIPIAVGKLLHNDSDCNYLKDNTYNNIADKNCSYCELTAQYWIWKNDSLADIKGLCHYRRYFTKKNLSVSVNGFIDTKYIKKILFSNGYDAIVSKKTYSYRGVKNAYLDCGYEKDLETTREVIREIYPEYLDSFDQFMDGCWGYVGNMFIAKASLYNQYSKWLFDILFEVEKRINIKNYSPQEARVFGYISERLLTVWIIKNDVRVKELRVVNTEQRHNTVYYFNSFTEYIGINQGLKQLLFRRSIKK